MNTYDQALKIAFAIEVALIFPNSKANQQVAAWNDWCMPACLEISRERLLMVSIISHCLFQIPKNLTNSCKQWCNTTLLLLVLVRTHPVFSN